MEKYGVTLQDNPDGFYEWINHAQEEAMDFILYLEKIKKLEQMRESELFKIKNDIKINSTSTNWYTRQIKNSRRCR